MNLLLKLTCLMHILLKLTTSQRRILGAKRLTEDKPYMVYLLKAPESHAHYKGWLCGGSIIHPLHILTASSCVKDAYNVYVISGLRDYINEKFINDNACTKRTKKKVMSICEFKNWDHIIRPFKEHYTYNGSAWNDYWHANTWGLQDLAVARVDTPFDFYGEDYLSFCHYQPKMVSVNLLKKYETPGTDAIVMGWGTTRFYRPLGDKKIYNEPTLMYTSTRIKNMKECMDVYYKTKVFNKAFTEKNMSAMICTQDKGDLKDNGMPEDVDSFCYDCEENVEYRRWYMREAREPPSTTKSWIYKYGYGICQNDHGGPLVKWIGGRETVIGVASIFIVSHQMECMGPFLYTSTACAGKLIYCTMSAKLRRSNVDCDELARKSNTTIVETVLQWKGDQVDFNATFPKQGDATKLSQLRNANKTATNIPTQATNVNPPKSDPVFTNVTSETTTVANNATTSSSDDKMQGGNITTQQANILDSSTPIYDELYDDYDISPKASESSSHNIASEANKELFQHENYYYNDYESGLRAATRTARDVEFRRRSKLSTLGPRSRPTNIGRIRKQEKGEMDHKSEKRNNDTIHYSPEFFFESFSKEHLYPDESELTGNKSENISKTDPWSELRDPFFNNKWSNLSVSGEDDYDSVRLDYGFAKSTQPQTYEGLREGVQIDELSRENEKKEVASNIDPEEPQNGDPPESFAEDEKIRSDHIADDSNDYAAPTEVTDDKETNPEIAVTFDQYPEGS